MTDEAKRLSDAELTKSLRHIGDYNVETAEWIADQAADAIERLSASTERATQMTDVVYEKQRTDWDCGICCLAMISGISYAEVLKDFAGRGIEESGVIGTLFDWWFIKRGFATQVVHEEPADGWKPWAPVHIAFVRATRGSHVCVMDNNGRVFDPWDIRRKTLTHPDYKSVRGVIGIWPLASQPSGVSAEATAIAMREAAAKVCDVSAEAWADAKSHLRTDKDALPAHDRFFNYIENARSLAKQIRALPLSLRTGV